MRGRGCIGCSRTRQSEDRPKSGPLQRAFIDGALIESLQ
jgi:hypothetical protein